MAWLVNDHPFTPLKKNLSENAAMCFTAISSLSRVADSLYCSYNVHKYIHGLHPIFGRDTFGRTKFGRPYLVQPKFGPTHFWSNPFLVKPNLVEPKFGPAKFGRTQIWSSQIWSNRFSC